MLVLRPELCAPRATRCQPHPQRDGAFKEGLGLNGVIGPDPVGLMSSQKEGTPGMHCTDGRPRGTRREASGEPGLRQPDLGLGLQNWGTNAAL